MLTKGSPPTQPPLLPGTQPPLTHVPPPTEANGSGVEQLPPDEEPPPDEPDEEPELAPAARGWPGGSHPPPTQTQPEAGCGELQVAGALLEPLEPLELPDPLEPLEPPEPVEPPEPLEAPDPPPGIQPPLMQVPPPIATSLGPRRDRWR